MSSTSPSQVAPSAAISRLASAADLVPDLSAGSLTPQAELTHSVLLERDVMDALVVDVTHRQPRAPGHQRPVLACGPALSPGRREPRGVNGHLAGWQREQDLHADR